MITPMMPNPPPPRARRPPIPRWSLTCDASSSASSLNSTRECSHECGSYAHGSAVLLDVVQHQARDVLHDRGLVRVLEVDVREPDVTNRIVGIATQVQRPLRLSDREVLDGDAGDVGVEAVAGAFLVVEVDRDDGRGHRADGEV